MLQRFETMTAQIEAMSRFLTSKPDIGDTMSGESGIQNSGCDYSDAFFGIEKNMSVIAGLIAVTVIGLLYLGRDLTILLWALTALALTAAGFIICRKARLSGSNDRCFEKWSIHITAALWVVAGGWALLAWFQCDTCSGVAFPFFKGAMVIVALTSLALGATVIRHATFHIFAPAVIAFALVAYLERTAFDIAFASVLAMIMLLVAFVQAKLNEHVRRIQNAESEKDEINQDLALRIEQAESATAAAACANRSKAAFLAAMSHDLRTPLNAIIGFSEVMKDEMMGAVGNPHYLSYAEDIHRSGRHLLDIIEGVLDLSRLEAGGYRLQEKPVFLADIVRASAMMVRPEAELRGITILLEEDENMKPLHADERALKQILINLISNAVKFSPNNSEIVIGAGWTEQGGQLLCVRDYGCGMDEETKKTATTAFRRGSDTTGTDGFGLGLSIVNQLALAHDAELTLETAPHSGTLAVVSFPMKRITNIASEWIEDRETTLQMPVRHASTLPFEADSMEIEAHEIEEDNGFACLEEHLNVELAQCHYSSANDDHWHSLFNTSPEDEDHIIADPKLEMVLEAEIIAALDAETARHSPKAANAA